MLTAAVTAVASLALVAVILFFSPAWSLDVKSCAVLALLTIAVAFAAGAGLARADAAKPPETVEPASKPAQTEGADLQRITDALASISQRLERLENHSPVQNGEKAGRLEDVLADVLHKHLRSGAADCVLNVSLSSEGDYHILGRKWTGKIQVELKPAEKTVEPRDEKVEVVEERLF